MQRYALDTHQYAVHFWLYRFAAMRKKKVEATWLSNYYICRMLISLQLLFLHNVIMQNCDTDASQQVYSGVVLKGRLGNSSQSVSFTHAGKIFLHWILKSLIYVSIQTLLTLRRQLPVFVPEVSSSFFQFLQPSCEHWDPFPLCLFSTALTWEAPQLSLSLSRPFLFTQFIQVSQP